VRFDRRPSSRRDGSTCVLQLTVNVVSRNGRRTNKEEVGNKRNSSPYLI